MSYEDLFKFVSAEEREQKLLDYQRKIFPLGLPQRDAALNAIRPLMEAKKSDTDLLYVFITAKQKYLESAADPAQRLWKYINSQRFSDTEKKYIMALVLLDTSAESLEEYPTAEDIRQKAE